MRKLFLLFPALLLGVLALAAPARAQTQAPARVDTLRGADYSDRVLAVALGIPEDVGDEVLATLRRGLRCMETDDAMLCNATLPGASWGDCANGALMGHFVVWFDVLKGKAMHKRLYVAASCGETQVTVSSLRKHPALEIEMETTRQGANTERRELVFIQTS